MGVDEVLPGCDADGLELAQMHEAPVVAHDEVVAFGRHRRIHGRGIGWVDGHLLASSLIERLKLWTTDPRLTAVAKELGVGLRRR